MQQMQNMLMHLTLNAGIENEVQHFYLN
jgi:hypothetical protein